LIIILYFLFRLTECVAVVGITLLTDFRARLIRQFFVGKGLSLSFDNPTESAATGTTGVGSSGSKEESTKGPLAPSSAGSLSPVDTTPSPAREKEAVEVKEDGKSGQESNEEESGKADSSTGQESSSKSSSSAGTKSQS